MTAAVAALGLAAGAAPASIITVTDGQHADIELAYHDGAFEVAIHLEGPPLFPGGEAHFETSEVLFLAREGTSGQARPAGAEYDFLGVPGGATVFVLPEGFSPLLPFIGVASAHDPDEDPFAAGFTDLRLTVVGVSGPGEFAVWSEGLFGPIVYVASADGLDGTDFIPGLDDHAHYNFGFTARGLYGIDVQLSGLRNGVRETSETFTLNFAIEPVPEPASLGLLALGGGVAMVAARRRRPATV
jgi:surface-anchored protein